MKVGVAQGDGARGTPRPTRPRRRAKARPAGIELLVEAGAGEGASFLDSAYAEAGVQGRSGRGRAPPPTRTSS